MSGLCLLVPSVPSAAAPSRSSLATLPAKRCLGYLPLGAETEQSTRHCNTVTLGEKTARGRWRAGAAGNSSRGTGARARSAEDSALSRRRVAERRRLGLGVGDDGAETSLRGNAPRKRWEGSIGYPRVSSAGSSHSSRGGRAPARGMHLPLSPIYVND